MKKIICLFLVILLLGCGCENKESSKVKDTTTKDINKEEKKEKVKDLYQDLNNTPIGIYSLQGNKLVKIHNLNAKLEVEKVINTFQIYPSNEEVIYLNNSFAQSFYDEWIKYKSNNDIKLGFNIKFTLSDGRNVSYNIFGPNETFAEWNYLMNYLYDDYQNRNKSFYSHIESNEVTPDTLYTAFKMQASYGCGDINSKIEFTVFTYDSEDDFLNNEYRGNSKYSTNICVEGKSCE